MTVFRFRLVTPLPVAKRHFETTAALRGRTSENRYPAFSFVKSGAGRGETVVAREVTAIYKENMLIKTRFLISETD